MKLFDLEKLIDTLTGFLETKIELIKLDAKEEISGLIAKALVFVLLSIFALLAILFLSISLSVVLNSYLESGYLGFVVVGIIYLGLAGLVYGKRMDLLEKMKNQANEDNKLED